MRLSIRRDESTAWPLVCQLFFLFKFGGAQARRQNSVTGGAELNFGGHEQFIWCEFERGTGAREIYPSLDQLNKVGSKDSKGFSAPNRKFKQCFQPKTGDLQKKGSSSQKRHEIRCQSTKNTNLGLDPVNFFGAQSSLGGHGFRLGRHKQSFGGARPRYAPHGAGYGGLMSRTKVYCTSTFLFVR